MDSRLNSHPLMSSSQGAGNVQFNHPTQGHLGVPEPDIYRCRQTLITLGCFVAIDHNSDCLLVSSIPVSEIL